jgi:predicted O-methyltransferase YrrM
MLSKRAGSGPRWYEQFPGEHYHLLTAMCLLLRPATVWEFGTDTGMSTVALLECLCPSAKIYTVDIHSWESKQHSWLLADDLRSGGVTQVTSDMKAADLFARTWYSSGGAFNAQRWI